VDVTQSVTKARFQQTQNFKQLSQQAIRNVVNTKHYTQLITAFSDRCETTIKYITSGRENNQHTHNT